MKTLLNRNLAILVLMYLGINLSYAQAPQKFSYQAVIRDADNELLQNAIIRTQISIIQGSADGTVVYIETHTPTTNENGLITLQIGGGTVAAGAFANIDWSAGPYFIKTETDPTGGTDYTISGTNQLLSVPYALYAEKTGDVVPGPEGPAGPSGESAYQIWLIAGNTGTEEEFLISLIGAAGPNGLPGIEGKSAYQVWLDAGNTGTEADFLSSLTGAPGPDGRSAYQVWLDAGNVGTEADFLSNMTAGADGADGLDGVDGKSAYQTWLDLGNSGTESDFIASLEGPVGPEGTLPQHTIGEVYGGGIVFYVYDNGQHGLIASTVDLSVGGIWSEENDDTRAKGSGIGAGKINTAVIISKAPSGNAPDFAAALCNEYIVTLGSVVYGDWYLPSKHELDLLFQQKSLIGSPDVGYWSSTESTSLQAWKQIFLDGNQVSSSKIAPNNVRAIRAF